MRSIVRQATASNHYLGIATNIHLPKRKMDETKDWYRMIEDVVQCPVCLKVSDVSYIHCERGHHMCMFCIKIVTSCPMCYGKLLPKFISHLAVNELVSSLSNIQLSIKEEIESSKPTKNQQDQSVQVQTDLLSVYVQTDETNLSIPTKLSVCTQTYNDYFRKPNNNNLKEKIINEVHCYPCLICWCYLNTYEKLKEHLHQNHKQNLRKVHTLDDVVQKRFLIRCDKLPWECDYAIITDNVLLFANFIIRSNGSFKCSVRFIKRVYSFPVLYYEIKIVTTPRLIDPDCVIRMVNPYTAECRIEDMYDVCFPAETMSSILQATEIFVFDFNILMQHTKKKQKILRSFSTPDI